MSRVTLLASLLAVYRVRRKENRLGLVAVLIRHSELVVYLYASSPYFFTRSMYRCITSEIQFASFLTHGKSSALKKYGLLWLFLIESLDSSTLACYFRHCNHRWTNMKMKTNPNLKAQHIFPEKRGVFPCRCVLKLYLFEVVQINEFNCWLKEIVFLWSISVDSQLYCVKGGVQVHSKVSSPVASKEFGRGTTDDYSI